jgi:hypothetical protein
MMVWLLTAASYPYWARYRDGRLSSYIEALFLGVVASFKKMDCENMVTALFRFAGCALHGCSFSGVVVDVVCGSRASAPVVTSAVTCNSQLSGILRK